MTYLAFRPHFRPHFLFGQYRHMILIVSLAILLFIVRRVWLFSYVYTAQQARAKIPHASFARS